MSKPKVSLEIWQLLTLVTIVLSIASSLMWFSNLQPKGVEQEFTFIDKTKTSLYNSHQKLAKDEEDKAFLITNLSLNQKCYSDISQYKAPDDYYNDNQKEITVFQQNVAQIRVDTDNNLNFFKGSSGLEDALNSLDSYAAETKILQQRQIFFADHTLQIQTLSSHVCQAKLGDIPSKLDEISKVVDEFGQSDNNYQDWVQNVRSWRDTTIQLIQNLKDKSLDDGQIQTLLKSFKDQFVAIFSVSYDSTDQMKKVQNASQEFADKLKSLENWEQITVGQYKNLSNKMVKIKDE